MFMVTRENLLVCDAKLWKIRNGLTLQLFESALQNVGILHLVHEGGRREAGLAIPLL